MLSILLQIYPEECIETIATTIHQSHLSIRMTQNPRELFVINCLFHFIKIAYTDLVFWSKFRDFYFSSRFLNSRLVISIHHTLFAVLVVPVGPYFPKPSSGNLSQMKRGNRKMSSNRGNGHELNMTLHPSLVDSAKVS